MNNKKAITIIIILGIITYLGGLYSKEILKNDIRYALFTSEIGKYGLGAFPTLNGQPYTDYPSIPVYMMYLASLKGTYVNTLTITIPSASIAIFILIMTYLLGIRISKLLGAYAVLLSFLMYEYLSIARSPSLDLYVSAATILSFYLIYTADEDNKRLRLFFVPLCFIFGFAMRGPIGSIIPSAVVFTYYFVNRKWKYCFIFACISTILTILCLSIWLYFCYFLGGKALLDLFFYNQFFNRFSGNTNPIWYYLTNAAGSYALGYPLALLVIILYLKKMFKSIKNGDDSRLNFLKSIVSWMAVVLLIFSIPGSKHMRYIVAAMPAAALTAAWIFVNFDNLKIFDQIKKILVLVCTIGPFLALVTVLIGTIAIKFIKSDIEIPYITASIIFLVLGISGIYVSKKLKNEQRNFILAAIMTLTFITIYITIVEKINLVLESSRSFVAKVERIRHKDNAEVCFFNLAPDQDDLKYLVNIPEKDRHPMLYVISGYITGLPHEPIVAKKTALDYFSIEGIVGYMISELPDTPNAKLKTMFTLCGLAEFSKLPANTIFIARKKYFEHRMPEKLKPDYQIVISGKMGHRKYVAFQKKNES